MTLIGNTAGKLHVQRQVEDYALRGPEFDEMNFLNFTVETYERRITNTYVDEDNNNEESLHSSMRQYSRYLPDHPKATTHTRAHRSENHNMLPNIVGSWLPRRDGEEHTKPYYFAAMLAFLKPWRELDELKENSESWESAFNIFMETASQRDRDVIAGCQYYYDSRKTTENRDVEEEIDVNEGVQAEDYEDREVDDENVEEPTIASVSD